MPLLISLDGNIGAGKTTLLSKLHEILPSVKVVKEPVDEWLNTKNENGENILQLYYSDPKRYAYLFQHNALMTRIKNTLHEIENADENDVIICERSIVTDRYVFAEMLRREGSLSTIEWDLYIRWYDLLANMITLDGIIMIDADSAVCSNRIIARGRKGEEHIPFTYLQELEKVHNQWLNRTTVPVLRIPTEVTLNNEQLRGLIINFITRLKGDL